MVEVCVVFCNCLLWLDMHSYNRCMYMAYVVGMSVVATAWGSVESLLCNGRC